jgi:beta-galactosidase
MYRLVLFFCLLTCVANAQSNDYMFPGQPASKAYIDVDPHGFTIDGKRTFLVSAGLEYARIPRELWKDRLLRLKRDGFNCVEIYTFWNFHESQEGKFEFTGDHDLDAFLKLVHEMGMYCIARVGPYYCAEWDFGGYPHWLRFKQGMVARTSDTAFVRYMDRFFEQLIPIVARNQINKGGSVILVQLENEHPASWGTYLANDYFRHLQQKALQLGIEVPYFFSGMHHGHDPAGDDKDLFDAKRPSPWFTTEYWSVWFDKYGSGQAESDVFGRRTWKIITRGGNGYNVYMAHGGSNFGYTNDDEDAASYDYGAALGQTGDLRPMYYQFKRNALFARSFEGILENSTASHEFDHIADEGELGITTRSSALGSIVSLDNNNSEESRVTYIRIDGRNYPSAGKLVIDPMEIVPLVHGVVLNSKVTLDWAVTRVLGVQHTAHITTIVAYGKIGSYGDMLFTVDGKKQSIQLEFSGEKPNVYSVTPDVRVIAVNAVQADRTWFLDENGVSAVVVGPEYIGEVQPSHITCERPWYPEAAPSPYVWVYDDNGEKKLSNNLTWPLLSQASSSQSSLPQPSQSTGSSPLPQEIALSSEWVAHDASAPAAKDYNDHAWLASKTAQQMGADGDTSAYAWYRTALHIPADGLYSLDVSKGRGRYIAFLDGKKVAEGGVRELSFKASKGTHTLAVFATHDGRDKLVSYIGKLDVDVKGIDGLVTLHKGAIPLLSKWKFLIVTEGNNDAAHIPASYENAVDYRAGADAFGGKKGTAWFHTTIESASDSIFFNGIDDDATVFINGQKAGQQRGWGIPFTVAVPKGATSAVVDVLVSNNDGRGGLDAKIKAVYKSDLPVIGWRMKGGPGMFEESAKIGLDEHSKQTGVPTFYQNHFSIDGIPDNIHAMWRVTFQGLSHGFIWVNGHNLGRYPEVLPIDGLYIPECWLHKGQNEVVIFDEYGNSPSAVKIKAEQQASRIEYDVKF